MVSMKERIESKLNAAFSPKYLVVENLSHLHAGHAGDDGSGESHFSIEIVSNAFEGGNRVSSQRRIFEVLKEEMKEIHALSISRCSIEN